MLKPWWNAVLNLLFPEPTTCKVCNQPIVLGDQDNTPVICSLCAHSALVIHDPICQRCGRGMPSDDESICKDCTRRENFFEYSRSRVAYRGVVKELIVQLKFQSRLELLDPLAEWLYAAWLLYYAHCEFDAIVPVPMSAKDERKRGFNQSRKLSESLGARTGLIVLDALVRVSVSGSQTSRSRRQRLEALQGAFDLDCEAVEGAGRGVRSKRILLVDDVYTTGSTATACSRALLTGGAASVHVLTVAR